METRQPPEADQFTQSGFVLGEVFCANTAVGAMIAEAIARIVTVDLISFFILVSVFILGRRVITTQIINNPFGTKWCSVFAHSVRTALRWLGILGEWGSVSRACVALLSRVWWVSCPAKIACRGKQASWGKRWGKR